MAEVMGQRDVARASRASARPFPGQLPHLVSQCAKLRRRISVTVGDETIQYLAVAIHQRLDTPQSLRQGQSHFWNVARGSVGHDVSAPHDPGRILGSATEISIQLTVLVAQMCNALFTAPRSLGGLANAVRTVPDGTEGLVRVAADHGDCTFLL